MVDKEIDTLDEKMSSTASSAVELIKNLTEFHLIIAEKTNKKVVLKSDSYNEVFEEYISKKNKGDQRENDNKNGGEEDSEEDE